MRVSLISGLTITLALLGVNDTSGQAPPVKFELTPIAGGTFFASDLPSTFQLTGEFGGTTTLTGVEIDDALTYGGRAGVRIADRFGIGATLLYAPLTYSTSDVAEQEGGLYTYGADFSYHAVSLSDRAAPFVVVGVGAKTYDFQGADLETDLMWSAGAGIDVALSRNVGLRLEARDYMSLFDPAIDGLDAELQHDLVLAAGLSLNFGPPRTHAARAGSHR
jgi:hypothetical protein